MEICRDWLPPDKQTAVVVTIDDIHPATSADAYEAGGDLGDGALGHVDWLLDQWPRAHVTLFTTPDWRQISPFPTRKMLAKSAWADELFLAPTLPAGTMAVENHPDFCAYLNARPRMEIGYHGLNHIHTGPRIPVEFQEQDLPKCERMLRRARQHFDTAGLDHVLGFQPPGWNLPEPLSDALVNTGFEWVAAARDIKTDVSEDALTNMSGPIGVSLIYPHRLDNDLLHFASNFQATSEFERAFEIAELGGLIAIKCHIVKDALGHVALDGVDRDYMELLLRLFGELDERFGDAIWWTSMGQIADHLHNEQA